MAVGRVSEDRQWSARLTGWVFLVGALSALAYGSRAGSGKPPSDALYRYSTAVGSIAIYLILLAIVVYGIGNGLPRRDFFALRRPPSWPRALGWVVVGYVTIFVGASILLWALGAGDEQGLTADDWDSGRAGAYAANFVAVAVVAPIVEELVYRGAGMSLLLRFGAPVAVVATAVGFGLGHGLLLALPALVVFGLVTAVVRLRTGSVYPTMLIHGLFNATSLIVSVAA
jgi:membrane protease YdiL (CAAX protease family)